MEMSLLPININDLLHGQTVEWERLEFKESWNPLAVLHTMCALANDFRNLGGGYIIIGLKEENGKPVLPPIGIEPASVNDIQKELLNIGFSMIQPYYYPLLFPVQYMEKTILVIRAMGGQTRPYKAKVALGAECKEYAYYIRKGSSTVKARNAEETELISLAASVLRVILFQKRYSKGPCLRY